MNEKHDTVSQMLNCIDCGEKTEVTQADVCCDQAYFDTKCVECGAEFGINIQIFPKFEDD